MAWLADGKIIDGDRSTSRKERRQAADDAECRHKRSASADDDVAHDVESK